MKNIIDPSGRFINQRLGFRLFLASLLTSLVGFIFPFFILVTPHDVDHIVNILLGALMALLHVFLVVSEFICVKNGRENNESIVYPVIGAIISSLYVLALVAAFLLQPLVATVFAP